MGQIQLDLNRLLQVEKTWAFLSLLSWQIISNEVAIVYTPSVIYQSEHSFSKGILKLENYTLHTIGKNNDFMIFEV